MKKIIYFKKIEEITPKSEYTNLITNIFGRRLDVYSEEGSIYVLTDPKLAYLTEKVDEIMELEMNNVIFKHISCKEVQEIKVENTNFVEIEEPIIKENKKNDETFITEKKEEDKIETKATETVKQNKVEETEIPQETPIVENEKRESEKTEDKKAVKLTKRKEREEKEKILENLEREKAEKSEKKFGIKEVFAVIFTIIFALVNIYLWMLIKGKSN